MKSVIRAGWLLCVCALAGGPLLAADSSDLQQQLADVQDRLSTALHSYTLLQDENEKLKDQVQSEAAEKTALQSQLEAARQANETLRAAAAAAAQVDSLREQLRQARDQAASLAQQNYALRAQLTAAQADRK